MNDGYACLLQELTSGRSSIGNNGIDQVQSGELPVGFPSDLRAIAQKPGGYAIGGQRHCQGGFLFTIGEEAFGRNAVDAEKGPVGAVPCDMVFGHLAVNGLSFRVEFAADEINANL